MIHWRKVTGEAKRQGDDQRLDLAREVVSEVRETGRVALRVSGDAIVVAARCDLSKDEVGVYDAIVYRVGEDQPEAGQGRIPDADPKTGRTIELKTWPEPFEALRMGQKTHEVRVNDRGYRSGDVLLLREWKKCSHMAWDGEDSCPECRDQGGVYTGRSLRRLVTHVTEGGTFGLPPQLCVMSVRPVA